MNPLTRFLNGFRRATPVGTPTPRTRSQWVPVGRANTKPRTTPTSQLQAYTGYVYAAASTLSSDVRATPWNLWRKNTRDPDDWTQVDPPDALLHPDGETALEDMLELLQLHVDLTGKAFIHRIRTKPGGRVIGHEVLYPHWVQKPLLNQDGTRIRGWRIQIPGRTPFDLPAEDVIRYRYPHPLDPLDGASPVQAFAASYDMDLYARAYGADLVRNRAVPDIVINHQNEQVTRDQRDTIREGWKERYQGIAGEVAVMPKGSSVQQLAWNPRDLAFIELANLSKETILEIYKVPPSKLGNVSEGVSRANAETLDYTYVQNALTPRLRRLEHPATTITRDVTGDDSTWFEFDPPNIRDKEHELKAQSTAFRDGVLEVDEYRKARGLKPYENEEGRARYVRVGVTPRGPDGPTDPPPEPEEGEGGRAAESEGVRVTDEEMERIALRYHARQDPLERSLLSEVRKHFSRQQKAVLNALTDEDIRAHQREAIPTPHGWEIRVLHNQRDTVSTALLSAELGPTLETYIFDSVEAGWLLAGEELPTSVEWDTTARRAEDWARRTAAEHVTKIEATTEDALRNVIADAVAEDAGRKELEARIAKEFDEMKGHRARTIARTETANAFSHGRHEQAVEVERMINGTLKRAWNASLDGATRTTHRAAHATYQADPIPLHEPFEVGGASLKRPGDPAGPAEEIINCRCVETFVVEDA